MMAVATVATLPILVLFIVFQRNFIEGVTAGAVKY
jgi:ABC-type glycerol-3-phosphate transport system permease component